MSVDDALTQTDATIAAELAGLRAELRDMRQATRELADRDRTNALRDDVPTLARYLPGQLETRKAGSRRTYRSPLRRLLAFTPCVPLPEISAQLLRELPDGQLWTPEAAGLDDGHGECDRLGCEPADASGVVWHRPLGEVCLDVILRDDLDRFASFVEINHRLNCLRRLLVHRRELLAAAGQDPGRAVVDERDLPPNTGASGREGAVTAMVWLFGRAEGVYLRVSPAAGLSRPKRVPTVRRAFTDPELAEVAAVALASVNDPGLARLLLWLHLESGARQGEALVLDLTHIDVENQILWLGYKGGERLPQPVSMSLIVALIEHAVDRGAVDGDARVLRNRFGRPISKRTHEDIWKAVRRQLSWAADIDAATHCLRKTGGSIVERVAGTAVSDGFLRHRAPTINGVYTGATREEVATAVADLTGEPHPRALRAPRPVERTLRLPL
jgi:integrase